MRGVKFVKRDVTLEEIRRTSLPQRFYFEWANNWSTDWKSVMPNINPLYWCAMDVLKVIYIPILAVVIWPLLLIPAIIFMAHRDKWISGPEDDPEGWYISNAKWMEISEGAEK